MPMKTCSGCEAKCGPRTLYCPECGEEFTSTLIAFGHKPGDIFVKAKGKVANATNNNVVVNNNITISSSGVKFNPNAYSDNCGELNLDPGHLFDDLYGKEDALTMIMSALRTYNDTNGDVRIQTLIIGEASAGKSELLNRVELMVGRDNVMRFNSESASKAGMENEILNYPGNLPPLLLCEELEKTEPDNLRWLLPALDTRQEIIKVTAKEGVQRRRVPFICVATCNDLAKLEKMHSNSIANRFANKVYVKGMDNDTLYQILLGSLKKLPSYDERWIQPAIDIARELGDNSVRKCTAILLCGREKLLTGEYQKILRASGAN